VNNLYPTTGKKGSEMSLPNPTDNAPAARRNPLPRVPRPKHLKWLAPYRDLGYSFEVNGHLKIRDPEGRFVIAIATTPTDSGYTHAQAKLRRHERNRSTP
jgi:hypothetical protein